MKPILLIALSLSLPLTACGNFKRPSSNPAKMSADTLCYRAAAGKKDEAVLEEIKARNLDCASISADDPLLNQNRY